MADSYENTKMPDRPEEEIQPDIIPVDDKGQPLPDPSEFLGSYIKPRSLDELQKAYGAAEEDETIKDTMEPVQPTSFFRKHRPGRRGYDYYGTPAGSIPNDSNGLSESPLSKHFTAAEAIDPEFTEDENGEEIPFIQEEPQINMGKVVTPEQKPFDTAEEENDGYNKLLDSKKELFSKPEVKKDKDAPRIMDLYKDSMNTKVIYQAGQDEESSLGSLSREEATELFKQPQTKLSSRKLRREQRRALKEKRKLEKKKEKERRKAEKAAEKARKKAEKAAGKGKAPVQEILADKNENNQKSAAEAKKAEEIRKSKEAEEKRIKAQEERRRKQEEEKRIQQLRLEAKKTVEEAKKQLEKEKAELMRSQQEKMKEQESRNSEALKKLEEEKSAAQKAAQEAKQAREEAERMKAELEKMKLQAENALRQKTAAEEAAKAERQERERLENEAKRREEAERRRREEFEKRRAEENRKRAETQRLEAEKLKQQREQSDNRTHQTNGYQQQNTNQQYRQNNNNYQKHKNNQNHGNKNNNHNNSNGNPPARKTNTETTEDIKRRLAEMTSRLDNQQ